MTKELSIAAISQETGLSADTIRYYEKIGLVPKVARRSGVRAFTKRDLAALEFVKCFRSAGMSIERLKAYMALVQADEANTEQRLAILLDERADLEIRYQQLSSAIAQLDKKIQNYQKDLSQAETALFQDRKEKQ